MRVRLLAWLLVLAVVGGLMASAALSLPKMVPTTTTVPAAAGVQLDSVHWRANRSTAVRHHSTVRAATPAPNPYLGFLGHDYPISFMLDGFCVTTGIFEYARMLDLGDRLPLVALCGTVF